MSELSKRLPDDNEKLQPLVGEISWSENLILMAGGKDNLNREFYHAYRDLPKVQPPLHKSAGAITGSSSNDVKIIWNANWKSSMLRQRLSRRTLRSWEYE